MPSLRSIAIKPYLLYKNREVVRSEKNAVACQNKTFKALINKAKDTEFGKEHQFNTISNYAEFKKLVPLRDYEELLPWLSKVIDGESNIVWPGRPVFFAKSSGTTSGTKYIPVSKELLANHINSSRYMGISYAIHRGTSYLEGKILQFADPFVFDDINGVKAASISACKTSSIPAFFRKLFLPSQEVSAVPDYKLKLQAMVAECIGQDIRMLVAMPAWLIPFLKELQHQTGKSFSENFPNFQLLMMSGMRYQPYLPILEEYMTSQYDVLESYPASEGIFAYQDRMGEEGMVLVSNQGIHYEFVPTEEVYSQHPTRLSLEEVELDKQYALILNTCGGLWGYILGDSVKFISLNPYRIIVSGRTSQYMSAFGEHILQEEAENCLLSATGPKKVSCFTASPIVNDEKPHHKWYVEFLNMPDSSLDLPNQLDHNLRSKNLCYDDLRNAGALDSPVIIPLKEGALLSYLISIGKQGAQHKVPRLRNDTQFTGGLEEFLQAHPEWRMPKSN